MSIKDVFDYNGLYRRPTLEELINYTEPQVKLPDRSVTFATESSYSTQVDGTGMMELEDQERRDMIERQKEDVIRHIASSSEYSANALRVLNPPT